MDYVSITLYLNYVKEVDYSIHMSSRAGNICDFI